MLFIGQLVKFMFLVLFESEGYVYIILLKISDIMGDVGVELSGGSMFE